MKLTGSGGNAGELTLSYSQEEKPDWDYARNRSFALKRTNACWSSCLFSVEHDGFTLPNRDYPHQGLVLRTEDGYFKFIDAILFKLQDGEDTLELSPCKVEVAPWKATYFYEDTDTEVRVTYYLAQSGLSEGAGGWVKFEVTGKSEELELVISPLVDTRKLEESSPDADEYGVEVEGGKVFISKDGKEIAFGTGDDAREVRENIAWNYKLGDGYREIRDGEVRFQGKRKEPSKLGEILFDLSKRKEVKLAVACGSEINESDLEFYRDTSTDTDLEKANELLEGFNFSKNGLEERLTKIRLLTLSKFSVEENGLELPEAGEWWFKEVWFRDLFEILYHNMEFYRAVKGDNWLKKVLGWAKIYIKDGVMASKIGEDEPEYNSIDASLLYLLCASRYYEKTGDEEFKESMEGVFESVIDSLEDENGLVRCRPEYSWMDITIDGRSTRIPEKWEFEDPERFLLPEINALWLRVLEQYNRLYGADKNLEGVWNSYKETFWDEKKGFLYHLVYKEGEKELRDFTESSAAVVSLALLKDYFFGYEIREAWEVIKGRLLVWRKPVFFDDGMIPFGVLVKNSNERIYLDDRQYHEAVVWPRDLPYLFDILDEIGRTKLKEKITRNLMDHQASEGVVFYNHELFSLPEGKNPSQGAFSSNPVPVKNPIQLWSHFIPDSVEVRGDPN
ncbi:MAG: amylo-alpha-1,6-glucosidase [Candidatus Aenigmatarchaeota archaeon]